MSKKDSEALGGLKRRALNPQIVLLYVRIGIISLSHVHESVNHARADGFPMRQDFMAKMLAEHRTAVSEAAPNSDGKASSTLGKPEK